MPVRGLRPTANLPAECEKIARRTCSNAQGRDTRRMLHRLTAVAGVACCLMSVLSAHAGTEVLLIPDSGNDKVWALSPVDGAVINTSFIAPDIHLKQPIQVIPSGTGTLIITDELQDSVFEYSATGFYLRTLASPADGLTIGAFGGCMKDGFFYFTSGFSSGAGRILRLALDGTPPTLFCDFSAKGDPRGILAFGGGFLVGNSTTDDIEFVSAAGVISATPFHNSDGITSINFPQQLLQLADGTIMATGFSAPWGLFFFEPSGAFLGAYTSPQVYLSPRGSAQLDNGNYIYTGGTRIDIIDAKTQANTNVVNQLGTSFRWVTRFTPPPPCTGDIDGNRQVDASDLANLLADWGATKSAANLDGSGTVDAADLAVLLGAWGPC